MTLNLKIDESLIGEAMKLTDSKSQQTVVEEGLRLLIQLKKQETVRKWKGKLKWEGDLEQMRLDQ